jgi:hypothetical protein
MRGPHVQAIRRRQGTHGQPTGNTRYILDLDALMVHSDNVPDSLYLRV